MTKEVLPDSRAKVTRGAIRGPNCSWIPIFCANCGTPGGLVPEENMTFAFWLCNPCWEKHGAIAATYVMPDEVFWAEVAEEQKAKAIESLQRG